MICKSVKKLKDVKHPRTGVKYSVYLVLSEDNDEKWLLCKYNNREEIIYACNTDLNPTPEDMIDWFFGEFENME